MTEMKINHVAKINITFGNRTRDQIDPFRIKDLSIKFKSIIKFCHF